MSEPLILRARAAAPQQAAYRALTEPAELRTWFAEHAEVDLPHRYAFWGCYTPDGDAPHQQLEYADAHTLRFTWLLGGEETTTEITLAAETANSTIVSVSQTHFDFQEALSGSTIRGVLQTFWALALANLADYLEGRPITHRCDFTSSHLRADVDINAPRQMVYAALTDSDKASTWFGFPIGIEPRVGGRFAMGGFDAGHAAKIVDLEPERTMSVDFGDTGIGTWELADSGGKTRLTFVQSGFKTTRPPYAAWLGT